MKTRIVVVIALVVVAGTASVRAERADRCIQECNTQQKACLKNYPAATCRSEHAICVKSCKK
jgi:hypothetical protein